MADNKQNSTPRYNLRTKVLLPMSIGLLVFLLLFVSTTTWYLQRQINRDLKQTVTEVNIWFDSLIEQRTQLILTQLEEISSSTELQQLMQQQDRAGLLIAIEPHFKRLKERLGISHCYFHRPDKTVLLRVHNPDRHGDRIERYTLNRAAELGEAVQGLELGPLGTFTHRVVIPWRQNNQLLGYLELGEDISFLLKYYLQHGKTELAISIFKNQLNRDLWLEGTAMLGKTAADWDLLPDRVILETTAPTLLPDLVETFKNKSSKLPSVMKLGQAKRSYRTRLQPLLSANGQQVGDFIILSDITAHLADYEKTVIIFTMLSLITGGGFLIFAYTVLSNTQYQLKLSDRKLVAEVDRTQAINVQLQNEVEERKAAEAALNKIHSRLEALVKERTEQLMLSLEQIQNARKQLNDIVTSVTDGLIVTDLEGNLELLNPSAEEMFDCCDAEYAGKHLEAIIRDPAMLRQMEEALRQRISDLNIEVFQMTPNLQKPTFLQARTSVLFDRDNQPAGMIFLIHDITHEREVDRIKNEFISTAVHELSTPLTAVMGYSELLLSEQDFPVEEQREFLSIINEKSEFLSRLVGEILDISRIESGKPLELLLGSYSVAELFERPIHHFRHFSKNHPFTVIIDNPELTLAVDKEKIWQVMENLCSNAVKYSPEGGEVKVSGQICEGGYQLTVADQGVGLTDDQQIKVFDKFYRCNQSDTSVGGTGLGLTIVKSIIEAHSGRIWIESELGQGARVHFMLPRS